MLRQRQARAIEKTPHLCGWAYRTLFDDRACHGMDLRHFQAIYHNVFRNAQGICNLGDKQCNGSSSAACGRLSNVMVKNQSMHTQSCDRRCTRLYWDSDSFLSISGPRAIDVVATDRSNLLKYCEATEKTLTVSHVWSHGQGGRPESIGSEGTGFNACLHRRYSALAALNDYTSYWMDTPCIPSDPKLRWDCIEQITDIFFRSTLTVVCDRDLMTLDIFNITTEICEKILAVLLMCDWNMRAWTMLEAMRGRSDLYIFGQDDRIIRMVEILRVLQDSGRIDLLSCC